MQAPILSLAAVHKALSQQRLGAYATASDKDEIDRVARYLWNMALASALQGSLHVFEVTLRNAIYGASVKLIDTSKLRMPEVPAGWTRSAARCSIPARSPRGAEAFRPEAQRLLIGRDQPAYVRTVPLVVSPATLIAS